MKQFKYWLPVILCASLIFYLSTLQGVDLPIFPYADKVAHIGIYSVFGFFIARALMGGHSLGFKRAVIWSFFLAGLYGISDEFHQNYVPTRSVEVMDVMSDFAGGLIGSVIYGFVKKT